MEIEQSPLYPEIQSILNTGPNPVHFLWKATIHVMQRNLDFAALKVIHVDTASDYEVNFSDEMTALLSLNSGQYANQIYPFQDNLEITISKYPLTEIGDQPDPTQPVQSTRYQATVLDKGDPQIEGNGMNTSSQEALDLTSMHEVEFQLIDKSLEQLKMAGTGGIHRQAMVGDVVKAHLTRVGQSVQTDQSLKLKGVEMVPPSNQNVMNHVIIPHGIPLKDVPEWIHERAGGIYSAGLGSYLRNGIWHIYPSYDTTRFPTAKSKVTIIIVQENRFPGVERTYRQSGDNLVILATGQVKFRGDSTPQQLNKGNGLRFADASKIMEGFVKTTNNKALAARGNLNNEFLTAIRPNGLNNVQLSRNPVTANPFAETSDMTRRNGSVISCVWENSNDTLLRPDTMANVLYLANDTVQSLNGVLLKTHTYTEMSGKGMMNGRHVSRTAISVFIQNPTS